MAHKHCARLMQMFVFGALSNLCRALPIATSCAHCSSSELCESSHLFSEMVESLSIAHRMTLQRFSLMLVIARVDSVVLDSHSRWQCTCSPVPVQP